MNTVLLHARAQCGSRGVLHSSNDTWYAILAVEAQDYAQTTTAHLSKGSFWQNMKSSCRELSKFTLAPVAWTQYSCTPRASAITTACCLSTPCGPSSPFWPRLMSACCLAWSWILAS